MADRLNGLPKYVVSSTLEDPDWNNSTVLHGDAVAEVSKLRQELSGDIVVYGSTQLVRMLMEHDLVDELPLRLVGTRTVGDDLAFLTYAPSRAPER